MDVKILKQKMIDEISEIINKRKSEKEKLLISNKKLYNKEIEKIKKAKKNPLRFFLKISSNLLCSEKFLATIMIASLNVNCWFAFPFLVLMGEVSPFTLFIPLLITLLSVYFKKNIIYDEAILIDDKSRCLKQEIDELELNLENLKNNKINKEIFNFDYIKSLPSLDLLKTFNDELSENNNVENYYNMLFSAQGDNKVAYKHIYDYIFCVENNVNDILKKTLKIKKELNENF